MASRLSSPNLEIALQPLAQSAFQDFGHVVAKPSKHPQGTTADYKSVTANQGSATKYQEVTDLTNHYDIAQSKKPAKPRVNLFSCKPRQLRLGDPALSSAYPKAVQKHYFDVKVLERHPYTSQTFIPLGFAGTDRSTQYLVIVAPTLPSTTSQPLNIGRPPPYPQLEPRRRRSLRDIFSRARPSPFTNEATPPAGQVTRRTGGPDAPRGVGMPDLNNVRAFIATGDQAVTYGPGTWHAPMVALGKAEMDFVVVQYMNGVGIEDCQEVEVEGVDGPGISICIDGLGDEVLESGGLKAKL